MSDPLTWNRNDAPKTFFNPLTKNIVLHYINDANESQEYTLKAYLPATHPTYLANWMIEKLIDEIINYRELGYITPEQRAEIKNEVENE